MALNLISDNLFAIICAAIIGMVIGLERAYHKKQASITTFSLISIGSCLFTLLSIQTSRELSVTADPLRLAAQIVAGIGFVGGGIIFKTTDHVEGITTAAMLWVVAALGMTCATNRIELAFQILIVYYIIIFVSRKLHKLINFLIERGNTKN